LDFSARLGQEFWMRAFLALDISPQVRAGLSEAIRLLRPESFRVKWVDPALIHVTLKFFADLPEERLAEMDPVLRAACGEAHAFEFRVGGLGYFGPRDRMRVLWCGVAEGAQEVSALQLAVEGALEPLGLPREDRPFSPHLTIGRLREPSREPQLARALEKMKGYEAGTARASELTLFSSVLSPAGPVYKAEKTWSLEGAP
jgi:RNA 2',3'-cyclic 3'-phosphodiesterase